MSGLPFRVVLAIGSIVVLLVAVCLLAFIGRLRRMYTWTPVGVTYSRISCDSAFTTSMCTLKGVKYRNRSRDMRFRMKRPKRNRTVVSVNGIILSTSHWKTALMSFFKDDRPDDPYGYVTLYANRYEPDTVRYRRPVDVMEWLTVVPIILLFVAVMVINKTLTESDMSQFNAYMTSLSRKIPSK